MGIAISSGCRHPCHSLPSSIGDALPCSVRTMRCSCCAIMAYNISHFFHLVIASIYRLFNLLRNFKQSFSHILWLLTSTLRTLMRLLCSEKERCCQFSRSHGRISFAFIHALIAVFIVGRLATGAESEVHDHYANNNRMHMNMTSTWHTYAMVIGQLSTQTANTSV